MMTLWCFLQGIIDICCLKINKCHGMVLFAKEVGGGSILPPLAWCKFIFRMDEGPESYVNRRSQRGTDNPGGGRGVESIFLLERRIYLVQLTYERRG